MISQWMEGLRPELFFRFAATLVVGLILGVERERHGRAAGLRTTLLVSLSACLVMVISDSYYLSSLSAVGRSPAWHPDPTRLAAGALSGMGFLGAGVIIRQTTHVVRGVTTAATLWLVTVIGLAFGSGAMGVGLLASLIAITVLYLVPFMEARIQNDWYSDLSVHLHAGESTIDDLLKEMKRLSIKVKGLDIKSSRLSADQHIIFHLKFKKADLIRFPVEVTRRIGNLPGVQEMHWRA